MTPRPGVGAVGGYTGAHMARAGEGDREALAQYDAHRLGGRRGSAEQRRRAEKRKAHSADLPWPGGFSLPTCGISTRLHATIGHEEVGGGPGWRNAPGWRPSGRHPEFSALHFDCVQTHLWVMVRT